MVDFRVLIAIMIAGSFFLALMWFMANRSLPEIRGEGLHPKQPPEVEYLKAMGLADQFAKEGDLERAIYFYKDALQQAARCEDPERKQAQAHLRLSKTVTDNQAARAHLEQALDLQTKALDPNDLELAETKTRLAWFYAPPNGDTVKGRDLLEQAIRIHRDQPVTHPAPFAETLTQYAFFVLFDDPERAATVMEEAFHLGMNAHGSVDPSSLESLLQAADYHLIAAKPDRAEAFLTENIASVARNMRGGIHTRLGWCALLQQRPHEALQHFEQAHALFYQKNQPGSDPLRATTIDLDLALAHAATGGMRAAQTAFIQAENHAAQLMNDEPLHTLIESMVSTPEPTEPPGAENQWTVNRWSYYRELRTQLSKLSR